MSNKNLIGIVAAGAIIAAAVVYVGAGRKDNLAEMQPSQTVAVQNQQQPQSQTPMQQVANQQPQPVTLAHILQNIPKYQTSQTREPFENCHDVRHTVMVTRNKKDGTTGGLIGGATGAVAGAAIGNNVAQANNGSVVGGVIGAVVGAVAGNEIEKSQTERVPHTIISHECSTQYKTVTTKTVVGYNVVYEYQGQQYNVFLNRRLKHNYEPIEKLTQAGA